MGLVGCPETSVGNYHYTLRNVAELRRCRHLLRVLKRKCYDYCCIDVYQYRFVGLAPLFKDCRHLALPLSSQYLGGCDKQQLADIFTMFLH
jgi:hypothetical protein